MTRRTRRFLFLLPLGALVVLLVLFGVEQYLQDGPNYTRIEPGLYVGGHVPNPPRGTTAVLNLCEQEDPYVCNRHLWMPIPDAPPAPDLDWLRRAVEFIDARRRAGDTVYVHCRNGVSRSGMVVVAYLMRHKQWSRDRALEFVRTKRPGVRPHPAFMPLLLEWERALAAGLSGRSTRHTEPRDFPTDDPSPRRHRC